MILAVIFFGALGLFYLLKPEIAWEIKHTFTVRNGEPTDYAIRMYRIRGIIFLVAAVVVAVMWFMGVR